MAHIRPLGSNTGKYVCTGAPIHANVPAASNSSHFIEVDQKAVDMVEDIFRDVSAAAEASMGNKTIVDFFHRKDAGHLMGLFMHSHHLVMALFKNFHEGTMLSTRDKMISANRSVPLSRIMEKQCCVCLDMAILAMHYFERNPLLVDGKPASVKMVSGDVLTGKVPYYPRGFIPSNAHAFNVIELEDGGDTYILDTSRPYYHKQEEVKLLTNISRVDSNIWKKALEGVETPYEDRIGFVPAQNLMMPQVSDIYGFADNNGCSYPLNLILGDFKIDLEYQDGYTYFEDDPYAPSRS